MLIAAATAPENLARMALVGGAFVWLFSDWLWGQHLHSSGSQDWNHSYVLPLIGIYLLWQHRRALVRAPVGVFWPGLAILVLAIACYVFFLVGFPNFMGQGFATILALFGIVLLMTGPRVMEFAFFPVTYLLLGVTIPEKVQIFVTFRLQQAATQGAYVVLSALGIQTDLQGNILEITAGDGTVLPLNVAEACSGMSMLIAFVALGVAVALVGLREWWQRVVLLMTAVPVAVGLNIARIAVLGLLSLIDPNLSAGEAHSLIGTLLLIPGLGVFLLIAWALTRAVRERAGGGLAGGSS
jgi:exosortase